MSTLADSYFPPPRNWDALEGMVFDVFSRRLFDPSLARYGRSGQAQHGVDILGALPMGSLGIQCKNHPGGTLTTKEVSDEIAKAEEFTPPLAHYIIVTSASRDAVLTNYAFALSAARKQEGKFTVEVIFWEDLCHDLAGHTDLVKKHYPQLSAGDAPQPNLDVLFASGQREVTLAADWEERGIIIEPEIATPGIFNLYPSWSGMKPAKHPGTTLLFFRFENLSVVEAKDVRIEIFYPEGGSMVHVSVMHIVYESDKDRATKEGEKSVAFSIGNLLHRPAYETESTYFVFPHPDTTYDLHWKATAGNMIGEAQGTLRVNLLGKDAPPTTNFPGLE